MSESLLPRNWTKAILHDIAEINPRHPKDWDDALLVSFAPMTALSESRAKFNFLTERPLGELRKGFTHFAEGDVLFAKITPCMENGKGAVATGLRNRAGCGTTELHVLRPRGGIDPHYLYHFLHQQSFRREAEANFTGTAGQARVPTAFIERAEIPLAPTNEQERIVAKLEKLLDKVESCQKRLAKTPILLKKFRQAVIEHACSGRLIDAEAGVDWDVASLGDVITEIEAGRSFRCEERPPSRGETGVAKVSAVTWGEYDDFENKTCLDKSRIEPRFLIRPGDFLFSRANTINLVGACVIVRTTTRRVMLSDKILRIRFASGVLPEWVVYWLRSQFGREEIERLSTGNQESMRNIGQDRIKKIEIHLPPLAQQAQIVTAAETLFAAAKAIDTRFHCGRSYVDRLKQSILAKAFRGELVPQDPNDEPATVLLERVRQVRETRQARPSVKRMEKSLSAGAKEARAGPS
jgi:type I restriction enzyme, S subunit